MARGAARARTGSAARAEPKTIALGRGLALG